MTALHSCGKNIRRWVATAILLLGTTGIAQAEPVEYPCDSVVLIGRIAHQNFTRLADSNDILGHGQIDFDVRIRSLLYGQENRMIVPVRVIAHTYARESVDFLFVLKRASDGRYDVVDGRVIEEGQAKPQLAAHCNKEDR